MDKPISGLRVKFEVSKEPVSQILGKNTPIVAAMSSQGNFLALQSGCTPLGFEENEELYMFGPNCKILYMFTFFIR